MTRTIFIAAALTLAVTLPAAPAHAAGVGRTFLSAAGSDSNNCANVLTPCRHLAAAYAATAANGEIYVLDPANYGSVTITGPVSIEGHGWASIAPPSGGNAITINAGPTDKINIIGVVLDGTALTGTTGIAFNAGGELEISDCVVRNFTGSGIAFAPSVAAFSSALLDVSDSIVADNGGHGIFVQPGGAGSVTATFNRIQVRNNADDGIGIYGNLSTNLSAPRPAVLAVVTDSVASGNSVDFHAFTVSGKAAVGLEVHRSVAANNVTGLVADASNATLRVGQSQVVGNQDSWTSTNSGAVQSYGDNYIDDNESDNVAPPNIIKK